MPDDLRSVYFLHRPCFDLPNSSSCYSSATKVTKMLVTKKTRLCLSSFAGLHVLLATLFPLSLSVSCQLIFTLMSPSLLHETDIWIAQAVFCHIFYFPKWKVNIRCKHI